MAAETVFRIVRKVAEIPAAEWDRLAGDRSPFLKWDWLDTLEQTGCAGPETGWVPHHLVIERGGRAVGACPMYLKLHSMGEFVFDYEWAEAARRCGIAYYPKLLIGVPMTPVTGPRLLTDPAEPRAPLLRLMGRALAKIAHDNRISSVHVNFCLEEESEALESAGFLPRLGIQFHWQNRNFSSFDDYLASFRSERRNKIKRERREIAERGITIRPVEGADLRPGLMRTMFRLYKAHIDRLYYGRQYLNREFFEEIGVRFSDHLCLMVAERGGKVIAGTFNVRDRTAMYGRYWGSFEDHPFLHFNVCYYSAIEHCIRSGLRRFEAGAGGSFKQLRGLDPEPTRSAHYFTDERFRGAVERYLEQERNLVREKRDVLLEHSQLKTGSNSK
ncbi:MAG TPA: GNAT family N-acetyltransferase [candidate division Zixibacteria bacterium]|nr:GNAT family N-acetyltransferase [candidate division Zixibacteria bacterium]